MSNPAVLDRIQSPPRTRHMQKAWEILEDLPVGECYLLTLSSREEANLMRQALLSAALLQYGQPGVIIAHVAGKVIKIWHDGSV